MSEQLPDALFGGFDGTEMPEPMPDPLGRAGWRDELPPFTLPPFPNTRLMREAIAAALGEDPTGPVDKDPGAMPAQRPAAQPNGALLDVAPPSVAQANAPQPTVAPPGLAQPTAAPPAHATAPLPRPGSQPGGPRPGPPGQRVRPVVPVPAPSGAPPPRRSSVLRYRPPLAAGSRTPVQLGDLRRRVGRPRPSSPLRTRSNGGADAFFVITAIIFALLLYGVVSGLAEAITRLIP